MASIEQMREEMRRIADVLVAKNKAYLEREEELIAQYGRQPLVLRLRLDDDFRLNHASGSAKTCAALVAGLGTAILAELAVQDFLEVYGRLPD